MFQRSTASCARVTAESPRTAATPVGEPRYPDVHERCHGWHGDSEEGQPQRKGREHRDVERDRVVGRDVCGPADGRVRCSACRGRRDIAGRV